MLCPGTALFLLPSVTVGLGLVPAALKRSRILLSGKRAVSLGEVGDELSGAPGSFLGEALTP